MEIENKSRGASKLNQSHSKSIIHPTSIQALESGSFESRASDQFNLLQLIEKIYKKIIPINIRDEPTRQECPSRES